MDPRSGQKSHLYVLVGAFALVAVVFLVAAVVAQRAAVHIEAEAADLQTNSLPSVTYLARARSDIGHTLPEITALADAPPAERGEIIERIVSLRRDVEGDLEPYVQTPWYEGERALYDQRLRPSLERFDDDLSRFAAQDPGVGLHAKLAAERAVVLDADSIDQALTDLLELNHAQAYVATAQIVHTRQRAVQRAIALEIGSSLVAAMAAWIAIRASRRFEKVLQQNAELQAARAEELESFAQRVAHDLLSPLSSVAFSLGAIERKHPDAETKELVRRTIRSLERSRQMVHGVFNFARSGAVPPRDAHASLAAAVRGAVDDLLATDLQSPPQMDVEPFEDCEVACDPAVLGVMLSNLLANAEKYTRDSAVRRIVVRAKVDGGKAHVEVEDTGPGLPEGLEHTIFEPYVRAPGVTQPGLGLGLATVKRFAVRNGGRVGVRRVDSGTVFWFELPRVNRRQ